MKCRYCNEKISGKYIEFKHKNYHSSCYYNYVQTKCDICNKGLSGEYFYNSFGDKYCKQHAQELKKCFSCSRPISQITNGGVSYNFTHTLCGICNKDAVTSSHNAQKATKKVEKFMSSIGFKITDRYKIQIADKNTLGNRVGVLNTKENYINNNIVSKKFKIQVLPLPKVHMESVVAHELFHLYCKSNDIKLTSFVEEGTAELVSYLYLDKCKSFFNSKYTKIYLNYLQNNISQNNDHIYGDGFRKAYRSYAKNGIKGVYKYIINDIS